MLTDDTEKLLESVEKSWVAVRDLLSKKQISPDDYYKMVVCFAFEYSQAGQHLRAAGMLSEVPLEYFRETQRKQMGEDPNYSYVSYTLALNLLQNGLVSMGSGARPTMAAASA